MIYTGTDVSVFSTAFKDKHTIINFKSQIDFVVYVLDGLMYVYSSKQYLVPKHQFFYSCNQVFMQ